VVFKIYGLIDELFLEYNGFERKNPYSHQGNVEENAR